MFDCWINAPVESPGHLVSANIFLALSWSLRHILSRSALCKLPWNLSMRAISNANKASLFIDVYSSHTPAYKGTNCGILFAAAYLLQKRSIISAQFWEMMFLPIVSRHFFCAYHPVKGFMRRYRLRHFETERGQLWTTESKVRCPLSLA